MRRDTAKPSRPLRADAERNKQNVLAAAHALFNTRGANVSLDEVALQAGVGIATLYRHYPDRKALLAAVCEDRLAQAAQFAGKLIDMPPDEALLSFLKKLIAETNSYHGLAGLLGVVLDQDAAGCRQAKAAGKKLLKGGQASGVFRKDVTFEDIVALFTAVAQSQSTSPEGLRRYLQIIVKGITLK